MTATCHLKSGVEYSTYGFMVALKKASDRAFWVSDFQIAAGVQHTIRSDAKFQVLFHCSVVPHPLGFLDGLISTHTTHESHCLHGY